MQSAAAVGIPWRPALGRTVYKSDLKGLVPPGIYTEIYPQQYSLKS